VAVDLSSLTLSAVEVPKGQAGAARAKVEVAASQFEALLVAQMLRHMRQSGDGGWMGTGNDQAGERMVELAEEQLAQALAAQGGLGLASMITDHLSRPEAVPNTEDSLPVAESPAGGNLPVRFRNSSPTHPAPGQRAAPLPQAALPDSES
jgi:peptidoglycan hydrolase FlgJ